MRVIPQPDGPAAPARRRLVPVLAVALAASTAWAAGTSGYILFHDEMLARLLGRVREVQAAYEERVGALQSQAERAVAERVRSREGFEGRLAALAERQALIERRQGALAEFGAADPAATGALPGAPVEPAAPSPADPGPAFDLRMRGGDRVEAPERRLDLRLTALEDRLDRLSEQQSRALGGHSARSSRNADRLRMAILQAGLQPGRFERPERGLGGPFVPVSGDAFDLALAEARRSAGEEERLRRAVAALPFRRPLAEEAVHTSGFGTRLDPFTRGLALHTGIDMRAEYGAPARATAAGRVTAAEANGGYGNMVEVDHGHGVVTRYAHLASYAVVPGQRVEAGAIVGRVGSTGRSTGTHLHYETRIDGEPVDPLRFLRAGADLGEAAGADPSSAVPGRDGLSAEAWLAWSQAQLQTLTRRK